ncbi:hypothetical protein [Thermomonas alba]|uniref:hypothetical protein n=1 Tax=Thermomonas alba TaxID=2888525 RepID=UPI001F045F43|nr:hypothetical protein [Thermomonas alba]
MSIKQAALMFVVPMLTAMLSVLMVRVQYEQRVMRVIIAPAIILHELGHMLFGMLTGADVVRYQLLPSRTSAGFVTIRAEGEISSLISPMFMLLGPALLGWGGGAALMAYVWTHHVPAWATAASVIGLPYLFNAGVLSGFDTKALGGFGKLVLLNLEVMVLWLFVHTVGL